LSHSKKRKTQTKNEFKHGLEIWIQTFFLVLEVFDPIDLVFGVSSVCVTTASALGCQEFVALVSVHAIVSMLGKEGFLILLPKL
jgi:hypothetical protein